MLIWKTNIFVRLFFDYPALLRDPSFPPSFQTALHAAYSLFLQKNT